MAHGNIPFLQYICNPLPSPLSGRGKPTQTKTPPSPSGRTATADCKMLCTRSRLAFLPSPAILIEAEINIDEESERRELTIIFSTGQDAAYDFPQSTRSAESPAEQ